MNYRREIDGLRALAVIPVILFHAGFEQFSGGFVGVDVFFVISGYLITMIILTELSQGKFSLVNFYERRARRILPALFLVMLICIPFAWLWLLPSDMIDFSQSLVAVSVFASNILFWHESGYFGIDAELKPLLHTWSLAVEEQYYLLYPLFLMLFWRIGRRWILVLLVIVSVISFAIAQWASVNKPEAAFYLLPARGWELLIGAFVAFYLSKTKCVEFSRGLSEVGGSLGLSLILFSVFAYSKATPFPGIYALIPTIGTALVILFATQQTIIGKFLGNKAFVGIGLVSYSAYLWHQPIFAFLKHSGFQEGKSLYFALIGVTFFLAYLTWQYVEKPFRDKQVFSREIIFSASLVIVAFFMAFGFVVIQFEGLKNRKYMVTHKELDYATHWIGWHDCNIDGFQQDKDGGCKVVKQSDSIHVLVIGDSHAGHYASGFLELAKMKHKNIAIILRAGCFPGLNTGGGDIFNCEYDYIQKALEYAVDTPLIETVILSGFGISKISGYELVDGTSNSINPERLSEFEAGLTRSLELLSKGKKSVVLIADNPEIPTRKPGSCLRRDTCDTLKYPRENYDRRNAAYNAILHRAKNKFDNLRVVYPHDTLCDLKYCYAFLSGNLLYQNGDHLTPFAGRLLIQKMFK